jgi:KipI family sensor histidine kinase inhibitor
VVELHSGVEYRVYMMGFTPGFPYLGGLNPGIATPRLASPRTCVPAGSVGIAGMQTGIYPVDSPGGWQIIGHTPLILFDKDRRPPFLLCPGDRVRFIPIVEGEIADAA